VQPVAETTAVLEMADWLLGVLMRRPARPSMHSKARPTRPQETASRIELPEGAAVSNQTQLGRRTDPNPLAGSPLTFADRLGSNPLFLGCSSRFAPGVKGPVRSMFDSEPARSG